MDKVVLVTGSSRGIGRSTILEFAKNGFNVVICYKDNKILAEELKNEVIDKYNVKAEVIKIDLRNELNIVEMISSVINKFGHIDVLVNNAGISKDSFVEDKKKDDFLEILDVNLVSQFIISREVCKYMMKEKRGSIVNISSTNAINSYYPESIDYDASKAGVISITKNLALKYMPYIRVNAIAPGWVDTDMSNGLSNDQKQIENKKIMLNRFADPEEISKVIYFIAVEATYINGETIIVDGGRIN